MRYNMTIITISTVGFGEVHPSADRIEQIDKLK